MKKIKRLSLHDALAHGVIASIRRDSFNKQVVCYTDLGSFFGAYSTSYYNKVYNSLLSPITLKVLADE